MKDNIKKVYLRSKQLQYLQNGPGFFDYDEQVDRVEKNGKAIKECNDILKELGFQYG